MATTVRVRPGPFRSAKSREDFWTGLICLAPAVLVSLAFVAIPIAFSLYISFRKWSILLPAKPFVGLDNYSRLFNSSEFWQALRNTAIYTAGVVPAGAALSLGIALLLNRKMRGLYFYRTAFFMPVVTSTVAVAVVWMWLYSPQYGPINLVLRGLHLPAINWLMDPDRALLAVMIMSVWKNIGYHMVIFLAGLQGIPPDYYEAAGIDGAGRIASFRYITWPLLLPTTGFVLITNTIFSFLVFGPIYVMTGGGPMRSTTVIVYYIYQRAFEFREMGYASAVAWVLFVVMMVLTIVQFSFTRKGVGEQ
jgi:multiple sugar transport system permease protein